MSIFNSILQKLGIQKPASPAPSPVSAGVSVSLPSTPPPAPVSAAPAVAAPSAPPSAPAPAAPVEVPAAPVSPSPAPAMQADSTPPAKVAAMPMVNVVSMLDELAKSHPGADWKVSINDLLMMLGFDHSYEYRKELAAELGCPPDLMADSARMNVWLHKTVLQKISENGGNIPASLLD